MLEPLSQSRSTQLVTKQAPGGLLLGQKRRPVCKDTGERVADTPQGTTLPKLRAPEARQTLTAAPKEGYGADAAAMHALGDRLHASAPAGFAEVQRFITLAADGVVRANDVDALLDQLRSKSTPLERGVVGPTGASATISMSVLGPIFGLYGFYAGCQIVTRSGDAQGYLKQLSDEIKKRRDALTALQDTLASSDAVPTNASELQQRIDALDAFRTGVRNSLREQAFNQAFPGVVQLAASVLILTLAVELSPTISGGKALAAHATTAGLSIAAASVLGVYAAGSLAKNLAGLVQSLRTHKLDLRDEDSEVERAYAVDYNRSVGIDRLYYGLNSVSWGVYVGGCVSLVMIASGVGLSHGAAVGAVVTGALAAVIWDCFWGERVGPHNALTPHVDRVYVNTWDKRVQTWALLHEERRELNGLMQDILEDLPPGRKRGRLGHLKVWQNVSKKQRYKLWQHVPMVGGVRRLAKWSVYEVDRVDTKIRDYMVKYTQLEADYLELKLQDKYAGLMRRREEVMAVDNPDKDNVDKVLDLWRGDLVTVSDEHTRLAALRGLHRELQGLDMATVRKMTEARAKWDRARLAFMSLNGYLGFFITRPMVMQHADWFRFDSRKTRLLRRLRVTNVRMSQAGYEGLVARGFTFQDERRFIQAVVNPVNNTYEIEVIHQLEKAERRNPAKRALEDQQRSLAAAGKAL